MGGGGNESCACDQGVLIYVPKEVCVWMRMRIRVYRCTLFRQEPYVHPHVTVC